MIMLIYVTVWIIYKQVDITIFIHKIVDKYYVLYHIIDTNYGECMINFLKYRTFSAIFSCLILLTCVSAYVYNYSAYGSGFNYSVDFTGGTQVLVEFDKSVTVSALTQALEKEYQGVLIREFSGEAVIP
jgi:preprotein translocase subunit SecF